MANDRDRNVPPGAGCCSNGRTKGIDGLAHQIKTNKKISFKKAQQLAAQQLAACR